MCAQVNLKHGLVAGTPADTSLAEAGTLQLEFFALSALTGKPRYQVRTSALAPLIEYGHLTAGALRADGRCKRA